MKILKSILCMTSFSVLGGCFYLGPPFEASKQFSIVPMDQSVVVGVTHVTLGSKTQSNRTFWDYTSQVIESLPGQPGYLGHKVRKRLFVNEAWTMTIWEDDKSLNQFVRGDLHGMAMAKGLPAVKKARFLRHNLPRSELPLNWDTAEQLMNTQGRDLY